MFRLLLLWMLLPLPCRPKCIVVEGDHITAGDLAQLDKAFASLPREMPLTFSPMAGSRRYISTQEISLWAAQNHLDLSSADLESEPCFERFSRVLKTEDVEPLLRSALDEGNQQLDLKVIEISRYPLPEGHIQFRRDAATPPPPDRPEAPFLWRGTLTSSDGRVYPFWVRVRVSTSSRAVRAKVDLPIGHVISEGEVEQFETRICPLSSYAPLTVNAFQEHAMRRSVRAGTMLKPSMIEDLPRVSKGTLVTVRVNSGSADLSFKARADINGQVGQRISLTNLDSRRHFSGTVCSDGTVSVDISMGTSRQETRGSENNHGTDHTTSKTDI